MIVVKEGERQEHGTETVSVYEYDTKDAGLGGAVAEIRGRYPAKGFVVNTAVKQLAFVISGDGEIISQEGVRRLSKGDVVFIGVNEKYAWDGKMELFIANAPRFDVGQYREVE